MAIVAVQNYPSLGLTIGAYGSASSTTVTSTNLLAWSFVAPKNPFSSGSMGITAVRFNIASVTASPKCTSYVYSDTSGVPNAAIANGTGVETAVLAAGWKEATWAGTLPVITEGNQYWIVWKCTTGTNFIVNYDVSAGRIVNSQGVVGSTQAGAGISWRNTVAQGLDGAWAGTAGSLVTGFRLALTNGTDTAYIGYPGYGATVLSAAGFRADGTGEIGVKLTTPANVRLRVKSVAYLIGKTGTPGNLSMKFYTGNAIVPTATSNTIPVGNINAADQTSYLFDFSTPLTLEPSTTYRFALSAASGDGSNFYFVYAVAYDTDANSTPLLQMGCITTGLSGGVWTDSAVNAGCTTFVLDASSTGPFGASSGAGGDTNIHIGMGGLT